MAYTWRRKTILAKLESGYAVDAAPNGTSDAIETENLAITPLQHGLAERNIDDGRLGNRGGFMVGRNVQVTFDVAFAGAGEAGTVPAYGSLLKACGMSEDIVTDESVAYAPIDDLPPSATLYVNVDRDLYAWIPSDAAPGSSGLRDLSLTCAKQINSSL